MLRTGHHKAVACGRLVCRLPTSAVVEAVSYMVPQYLAL